MGVILQGLTGVFSWKVGIDLPMKWAFNKSIHDLYFVLKIGYPQENELKTFIVVCYRGDFGLSEY